MPTVSVADIFSPPPPLELVLLFCTKRLRLRLEDRKINDFLSKQAKTDRRAVSVWSVAFAANHFKTGLGDGYPARFLLILFAVSNPTPPRGSVCFARRRAAAAVGEDEAARLGGK